MGKSEEGTLSTIAEKRKMFRYLAAGCLVCLGVVSPAVRSDEPASPKFQLDKLEKKLLELTNLARKNEELPPLKANPVLFKVARAHSANMAKQGKMEHDLDGKTPFQRLKAAGYQYALAGENIAKFDDSLEAVVKGWMNSPLHRKNILHKGYTEIGLGIVADKDGSYYYTQVFGRPRWELR